ncbi:hypothetical protein [Roseicyclus mahoneyensis]|uniref:Uncharacterized protein n=1 Tax=Roseicyclus mahoneyensis TaxID=164332 RepID=A0A316GIX3_9RHOB|nr:hypothetical protein [Roseicyclus mahoneyensis]PWK61047.1 hypothetical protein C7455_103247 [Roseicyclus mahoneyensis]
MKAWGAMAVGVIWLWLTAASVSAQAEAPHRVCDACVSAAWAADSANFLAPRAFPISCGAEVFPMRLACSVFGYLTPTGMQTCLSEDLTFWAAELAREEAAALSVGRAGRGDLYDTGLARCEADEPEGVVRLSCEVGVHWRAVMAFHAVPRMTDQPAPVTEVT